MASDKPARGAQGAAKQQVRVPGCEGQKRGGSLEVERRHPGGGDQKDASGEREAHGEDDEQANHRDRRKSLTSLHAAPM